MKNCIVAQSGGPTAAINASLSGVIKGVLASNNYDTIYGSINGILGVINNKFLNLSEMAQRTENFIDRLSITPAMYLGSCRYRLPEINEEAVYQDIFTRFEEMNIGAFFYIGGNDSMDTVDKLSQYAEKIGSDIKIAGVPKTIDNDLVETDHTPGYGSACKYLATTFREIAYDVSIYPVQSVTIVEVMGRDAGWLTAATALARNNTLAAPHLIYLPEVAFDTEKFVEDVKSLLPKHRNLVVAVSEGVRDKAGNYISASDTNQDIFGHSQLNGTGKKLELLISEKLGVKVRSIELNIMQRCSGHLISRTDIEESILLGQKAVELTETGESGFMTTINRNSNSPYCCEIGYTAVSNVANIAKPFPIEWITPAGNDVTEDVVDYVKPLIIGELCEKFNSGVIEYLPLTHLI